MPLPGQQTLEILVNGEVEPESSNELRVTFTDCSFQLQEGRPLRLPLPRPVGSLTTTWCDDDMRISRGGRGGIFVLRRIRVSVNRREANDDVLAGDNT